MKPQIETVSARGKRSRGNVIANLSPAMLARHLDAFEAGRLREAALIWENLEQRDDLLRTVVSKRKKSVARHGWTVLPAPNVSGAERARAAEHVKVLEHFYNHLECEHAVDTAERGGFKLLARQMMDAVGKRFAVHEIVWREANGETAGGTNRTVARLVEATFRFVPLAFFENSTGRLRFLEQDFEQEGRELEEGRWMITVGEGLMMASSTAWMFKRLSMDDWLKFSRRNGTPVLHGISASTRDSAEWQALAESMVRVLSEGESVLHSAADRLEVLDLTGRGSIPFPALVERIDRMLAAIWRGADLSTISRDRGYGASLQEKETCALEEDDAGMLTETLNRYVDAWVIRHAFGEEEKPLARVQVLMTPRECTGADLQVDEFLLRQGAPLSMQETLNRYGRTLPKAGETVLLGRGLKASLPESLQNPGRAKELENQGLGCGPTVSFRGCSPASLAPELTPESPKVPAEGSPLENQFTLLQEDWLQISPYGDFPHARGIQRVDRTAAGVMVDQFNSFRGRLGRLFGGVPVYIGHPDLPGASETADRKAYGWVTAIESREDGLYGRVKWSEAGQELLRNAHFKFYSPYWEAREIGSENGRRIYRPAALISVGLTNQPNIPVRPLANENSPAAEAEAVIATGGAEGMAEAGLARATAPLSAACTISCTEALRFRKADLVPLHNRRDRIREAVLAKVRLGLSYDDAWESAKREHPAWFIE